MGTGARFPHWEDPEALLYLPAVMEPSIAFYHLVSCTWAHTMLFTVSLLQTLCKSLCYIEPAWDPKIFFWLIRICEL